MPSYIRSNSTRFYAAIEPSYGIAAKVTSDDRFPASSLRAQQVVENTKRLDKTGTRTLSSVSNGGRRRTAFEIRTYLSSLSRTGQVPYGSLFQAGMGADPEIGGALIIDSVASQATFATTIPHGKTVGSGLCNGEEIRFVTSVLDAQQLTVNVPFSRPLASGAQLFPTITYKLATNLPSLSLYEYWDPITAVSRIVTGAAVDVLELSVNGDRHEITFHGPAADLIDSTTITPGHAGRGSFPEETALSLSNFGFVPGHLGQAWLGGTASQFFTVTEATIRLRNNIEQRNQEFGLTYPQTAVPGARQVYTNFALFAQDDNQTRALYSAAKNYESISMMLQMGRQKGQLMAAYLPNVTPMMPSFDDSETRLRWRFQNNPAQGTSDDELYIAFA